jgi:oxysterol-binding protein 1
MLQKICEMMRYDSLLQKASEESDTLLRLIYVSAFMIAQYAGTQFRLTKPFNPLLGETFEYKTKDWKYISEQVSHHPPISAAH